MPSPLLALMPFSGCQSGGSLAAFSFISGFKSIPTLQRPKTSLLFTLLTWHFIVHLPPNSQWLIILEDFPPFIGLREVAFPGPI